MRLSSKRALAWLSALASFLLGWAVIAYAAPSSLPPPPTTITTQAGVPFRLYDNVGGYQGKPEVGGLIDHGFNRVLTWDGANLTKSSWLGQNVAPAALLRDGGPEQADIATQVGTLCSQYVIQANQANPTLVIIDIEWPLNTEAGRTPRTYSLIQQNVTNLATVLRWVRTSFQNGPCARLVRLGAYGITPVNWNLFYNGTPNPASAASWRSMVQGITKQLAPYIDVLAPSLYAPYSAYEQGSPGYGLNHVAGWTNGAAEALTEARAAATANSLALVPFLGLRYYLDNPGSPQKNTFIEGSFIQAMLSLVTDPKYGCEGAVYWDSGAYGGKDYAKDGTNVWNNNYQWLTTTLGFFNAPAKSSSH